MRLYDKDEKERSPGKKGGALGLDGYEKTFSRGKSRFTAFFNVPDGGIQT